MQIRNPFFLTAGVLMGLASALHVGIILGGANWYRFFGAGEGMARLAERGSSYPTQITTFIVLVLALGAFYALKAAFNEKKLPLQNLVLGIASFVFLLRGLIGVPIVILVDDPYLNELQGRMTFMEISSLFCLLMGGSILLGLLRKSTYSA